jgi:hypothetical protein
MNTKPLQTLALFLGAQFFCVADESSASATTAGGNTHTLTQECLIKTNALLIKEILYKFEIKEIIHKYIEDNLNHPNQLESALHALKSFGLLDKMNPWAIKDIIVALPHNHPNQLESVLNVLKSSGLLDRMDPWAVKDIIVALPHSHPNQLESVLNVLKSFGLLDRMDPWAIKDIIVALPHSDPNQLESILNVLKSSGLLDAMDPWAIRHIIVALFHRHLQLESALNVLKSSGLLDAIDSAGIQKLFLALTKDKPSKAEGLLEFWSNSRSTHEAVSIYKNLLQELKKGGYEPKTLESFVRMKSKRNFPIGYFLWQSDLSFEHKEEIKNTYPEIDKDLPEGYGFIADDAIFTYYFHKGKPHNQLLLLLQGPDHNGALVGDCADLFFSKGYNVLVMDTRALKEGEVRLTSIPHASLKAFVKAHQIPLSSCLDMIFIHAHGIVNFNNHIITTSELKNLKVKNNNLITSEWIAEVLSSFSIQNPVKIIITSCYGWGAVEDTLKILPYGSEIVAFSKYRIQDGTESIESTNSLSSIEFQKNLYNYQPKNFENRGLSANEIALIYAISIHKNYDAKGGTLYAKKHNDELHQYVIFEDEAEKRAETSYDEATIDDFITAICSHESCTNEYKQEFETLKKDFDEPRIRMLSQSTREAFSGYLALEENAFENLITVKNSSFYDKIQKYILRAILFTESNLLDFIAITQIIACNLIFRMDKDNRPVDANRDALIAATAAIILHEMIISLIPLLIQEPLHNV